MRQIPWLIWLTTILVLSFIPGEKIPEIKFTLFEIDKAIHFTLYFVLAFLMGIGIFYKKNEPLIKKVVIIVVTGISIGYCVEVIQGNFIPNRGFDVFDIIANSIGSVIGFIFFVKIHKNKLKHW